MTRFLLALALIGCATPHYPVSFRGSNPISVSLSTPRSSPSPKPVPFYVVIARARGICEAAGLRFAAYNEPQPGRGPYVECDDANDAATYIDLPPEVFRP